MKYNIIAKDNTIVYSTNDPLEAVMEYKYSHPDCELIYNFDDDTFRLQCEKNMNDSIDRYRKRLDAGTMSIDEFQKACNWAHKNYKSGNVLYAYNLAKMLIPPKI